jgi:hypothetical protein
VEFEETDLVGAKGLIWCFGDNANVLTTVELVGI